MRTFNLFLSDDDGATAIEYGLVAAFAAMLLGPPIALMLLFFILV